MIETQRLVLRKWELTDISSMYKYAKDPDVGPIAGWPAHTSIDISKMVVEDFIKNHPYCYAITMKSNNEAIGCIELKMHPSDSTRNDKEAELGYWLGKPFWGNGIMVEAAYALMNYGFNKLCLDNVWVGHYEGNYKSKRVIEKLGFVFDHIAYNLDVPLLNEFRTGYSYIMSKEHFNSIKNNI